MTYPKAARAASMRHIGARIRWVREAYETLEPLQHSQMQWARALNITPEMLNRIELGKVWAQPHVIQRIMYFAGVSANFLFFGVLGDGVTVERIEQALIEAQALEAQTLPRFLEDRARTLQLTAARQARQGGAGRRRYQRKKKKPSPNVE